MITTTSPAPRTELAPFTKTNTTIGVPRAIAPSTSGIHNALCMGIMALCSLRSTICIRRTDSIVQILWEIGSSDRQTQRRKMMGSIVHAVGSIGSWRMSFRIWRIPFRKLNFNFFETNFCRSIFNTLINKAFIVKSFCSILILTQMFI